MQLKWKRDEGKKHSCIAFIFTSIYLLLIIYHGCLFTRDIDARRAAAMGSGERSDRVRTYNFPQVF